MPTTPLYEDVTPEQTVRWVRCAARHSVHDGVGWWVELLSFGDVRRRDDLAALLADRSPEVRRTAVHALSSLALNTGDHESQRLLWRFAATTTRRPERTAVLDALHEVDELLPEGQEVVLDVLRDPRGGGAWRAVLLARHCPPAQVVPLLVDVAHAGLEVASEAAVDVLGQLRAPAEVLVALLDAPRSGLRERAFVALASHYPQVDVAQLLLDRPALWSRTSGFLVSHLAPEVGDARTVPAAVKQLAKYVKAAPGVNDEAIGPLACFLSRYPDEPGVAPLLERTVAGLRDGSIDRYAFARYCPQLVPADLELDRTPPSPRPRQERPLLDLATLPDCG